MKVELGHISAIFRYPIKSMAGERLDSAKIGWHGVEGDRRLAFRRLADRGAFPWLTASRLPELLLYEPIGRQDTTGEPLPTHVRTPEGREYGLTDEALLKEIATRHRADVELMQFSHGIFDEAGVSAIALGTIRSIAREAGHDADVRRFRPNLVIDTKAAQPFEEDRWVGKTLEFGSEGTDPAISVTMRDKRCVMVNLDPDTAEADAEVMKTVIRMNDNYAGVYRDSCQNRGASCRSGRALESVTAPASGKRHVKKQRGQPPAELLKAVEVVKPDDPSVGGHCPTAPRATRCIRYAAVNKMPPPFSFRRGAPGCLTRSER